MYHLQTLKHSNLIASHVANFQHIKTTIFSKGVFKTKGLNLRGLFNINKSGIIE